MIYSTNNVCTTDRVMDKQAKTNSRNVVKSGTQKGCNTVECDKRLIHEKVHSSRDEGRTGSLSGT